MKFRPVSPLAFAVALGLLVMPASAPAASCISGSHPGDSAINQYCETIPSSGGPQAPHAGTPTLSATLPARVLHALSAPPSLPGASTGTPLGQRQSRAHVRATRRARERLLTLPAPAVQTARRHISAASAGVWAPITPLLVALVGLTLAFALLCAGLLFLRRRRESED